MIDIEKTLYNMQHQLDNMIRIVSMNKKCANNDIEAGRDNTAKAQRSADGANEKGRENEESIIAAEQTITDMDLQYIESEQMITDMDLRIMELEGKNE